MKTPTLPAPSASVEAASTVAASVSPAPAPASPAGNYQIRQVKTKVSKITKKRDDDSEITFWEVSRPGASVAKIYCTPHGERKFFTLSYWTDGKRKREVFPTREKAIEAAKQAGDDLSQGAAGGPTFTTKQRIACARALEWLAPTGVQIDWLASQFAGVYPRIKDVPFSILADCFNHRYPANLVQKTVREVADEMIQLKESDKLSDRYLKQLRYDMFHFSNRFHCRLCDVRGTDVDAWLRSLKVGPRTRNNMRATIQVLFNFGIARKYLPKDHDEIDAIPLAKDNGGEIEIFSPDEMSELLAVASPEQIPFLAISAFAGVRHAEVQRLDWENVKKKAGIIEIRADTAKTASRRVIPILPNLTAWLKPHWKEAGQVCSYINLVDQFKDLTGKANRVRRAAWAKANKVSKEALEAADERADARRKEERKKKTGRKARGTVLPTGAETAAEEGWAPFAWKHNALRHSFISYRVAVTQDVAKVSLEAGNSPQMIFQHYRELVQPKEAKAWFAIKPSRSSTSQ